jgi:hypothetical protein
MTWTKLPDEITEALWDLSHGAYRLHISAETWCNRLLTDGLIPASRLSVLMPKYRAAYLAELLAAGLWTATDGGYSLVDFLRDQPSKADVEKKRADWKRWQQEHRQALTPPLTPPLSQATTVPVPVPALTSFEGVRIAAAAVPTTSPPPQPRSIPARLDDEIALQRKPGGGLERDTNERAPRKGKP